MKDGTSLRDKICGTSSVLITYMQAQGKDRRGEKIKFV
jgi:hypothetical protein